MKPLPGRGVTSHAEKLAGADKRRFRRACSRLSVGALSTTTRDEQRCSTLVRSCRFACARRRRLPLLFPPEPRVDRELMLGFAWPSWCATDVTGMPLAMRRLAHV